MTPEQKALEQRCQAVRAAAVQGIEWVGASGELLRGEQASFNKDLRRHVVTADRLIDASRRPAAVGVFGPSQAGKSYLISALGRSPRAPLIALLGNQELDFAAEINPEGGTESTGLVTRFTIVRPGGERPATPPGHPVRLKLLSESDIVKILGNSFALDLKHSGTRFPGDTEVLERLAELRSRAQPGPTLGIREEDMWDLQDYFENSFREVAGYAEYVKRLRNTFWPEACSLGPRLGVAQRERMFSLLWVDLEPFSQLYRTLIQALQKLGFAREAYAPLSALVPRVVDNVAASILDVALLKGLGESGGATLDLVAHGGSVSAVVQRPEATALTAELEIVMKEKSYDFLDHADLLDFPGARSRTPVENMQAELAGSPEKLGHHFFLRGKVAYLFERYSAERELSSMLLCIKHSAQEVTTLPATVAEWIRDTHGATPEERSKQKTALFLVLTQFDTHFQEVVGETAEGRWRARMEASLLGYLARGHSWPTQWDRRGSFRNTYCLRNPRILSEAIFEYEPKTEDPKHVRRELALRASQVERLRVLRGGFLATPAVKDHFSDPETAWEELLSLNDGGVGHLARNLKELCRPELKLEQIQGQLERILQDMLQKVGPYHVGGDIEAEKKKKLAATLPVRSALIRCYRGEKLGELLAELQVDDDVLTQVFHRVENTLVETTPEANASDAPADAPASNDDEDFDLPDDVAELLGRKKAPPAGPRDTKVEPPASTRVNADLAARFAAAALSRWSEDLRAFAEREALLRYYELNHGSAGFLVQELVTAAHRLSLRDTIAQAAREALRVQISPERRALYPVRIAATLINGFVDYLGLDSVPLARRPTVSGVPVFAPKPAGEPVLKEDGQAFEARYFTDWSNAILRIAEENTIAAMGGQVDSAQNTKLGRILEVLRGG